MHPPQSIELTGLFSKASALACYFEAGQDFGLELPSALAGAVAKRQSEFLAGRWCVRQLYLAQGLELELPSYQDHQPPLWPAGWCGSISHTRGFAAAALGSSQQLISLGLDAEYLMEAETASRVRAAILHPQEESLLQSDDWLIRLTLIFSFKESLYKALNPLLKRFIGFQEVAIRQIEATSLEFSPQGQLAHDFPAAASLSGRWQQQGDLLLSAYEWLR